MKGLDRVLGFGSRIQGLGSKLPKGGYAEDYVGDCFGGY